MERSEFSGAAVKATASDESDWLARFTATAAYDVGVKAVFLISFLFIADRAFAEFLRQLRHAESFASPALFMSSAIARGRAQAEGGRELAILGTRIAQN